MTTNAGIRMTILVLHVQWIYDHIPALAYIAQTDSDLKTSKLELYQMFLDLKEIFFIRKSFDYPHRL